MLLGKQYRLYSVDVVEYRYNRIKSGDTIHEQTAIHLQDRHTVQNAVCET